MVKTLTKEKALILSLLTLGVIFPLEHTLAHSALGNIIGFVVIFVVIIYSAMSVAHHAEMLAHKYGEPYGTLILTIAAVVVEIVIIAIMMTSSGDSDLARDTIYSAIMLDINGLLGIAAIIGGIKHGEQKYNIDSSNSYMSMILVSLGIAMVLPHFIPQESMNSYLWFTVVIFILLYVVFTRIQLKEHKYFFEYTTPQEEDTHHEQAPINGLYHASILVGSIVVIGLLSELLAVFMDNNLKSSGLPIVLGAFTVAVISAAPELITAIRSAANDRMQTVVNIALGASLATVLLTIPSIIIVTKLLGMEINLALTPTQGVMLGLTFMASVIHFNDGETNVLEGFLHFILFSVFFFLMFV